MDNLGVYEEDVMGVGSMYGIDGWINGATGIGRQAGGWRGIIFQGSGYLES